MKKPCDAGLFLPGGATLTGPTMVLECRPVQAKRRPAWTSKLHLHRKLHFARIANLVAQVIGRD
jgi:hypothetical protein